MNDVEKLAATEMGVASRLSSPIVNTTINTKSMAFDRCVCPCVYSVLCAFSGLNDGIDFCVCQGMPYSVKNRGNESISRDFVGIFAILLHFLTYYLPILK